jgi:hypothetical protein
MLLWPFLLESRHQTELKVVQRARHVVCVVLGLRRARIRYTWAKREEVCPSETGWKRDEDKIARQLECQSEMTLNRTRAKLDAAAD